MNGLYIAKRHLRWAGILDLMATSFWCVLIFIFAIYSFFYLVPNKYGNSSSVSSNGQAAGIVYKDGYWKLFDFSLFHFLFFNVKVWTLVVVLWIPTVVCFLGKLILGCYSLFYFFKGKSIQHIYAALAVIFLPCMGGIIAINTYKATTGKYSPKYVRSNSFLRFKLKKLRKIVSGEDDIN